MKYSMLSEIWLNMFEMSERIESNTNQDFSMKMKSARERQSEYIHFSVNFVVRWVIGSMNSFVIQDWIFSHKWYLCNLDQSLLLNSSMLNLIDLWWNIPYEWMVKV